MGKKDIVMMLFPGAIKLGVQSLYFELGDQTWKDMYCLTTIKE